MPMTYYRNINPQYGDSEIFSSLSELESAIRNCGYTLPENGLQEGRDYECIAEAQPFNRSRLNKTSDGSTTLYEYEYFQSGCKNIGNIAHRGWKRLTRVSGAYQTIGIRQWLPLDATEEEIIQAFE